MVWSLAAGWLSASRAASAEEPVCTAPKIHLELDDKPDWAAEVPALRQRLLTLEHIDACAHVNIRSEGDGVLVDVTSGGRSAKRFVTRPSELARTVEALVVLPPPVSAAAHAELAEVPAPSPTRPAPAPVPTHMEIGVAASGRLGGSPLLGGGGLVTSAGLVDGGWLAGVSARWEFGVDYFSAADPGGFSMSSGAVGVELGHRWNVGTFGYDALVGPTVVFETQEADGPINSPNGLEGSALDVRLNLKLRASLPSTSRLRVYAAGDVEVSPHRLARTKQLDPDLPPLPAWTSGLALGFLWEAR